MILTPMTELDAINLMLSVIGEAPVNSLEVSGLEDVAVAKSILQETSREIQERGWNFNTENGVEYPLTTEGYINVPTNVLRIDAERQWDYEVTQRGTRMYDRGNHTYVFDKPLTFEVVFMLPFEELPQAMRHYLSVRAARKFQKRTISSDSLERFTQEEEMLALVAAQDQDCDTADYNMLTGNEAASYILYR